ncbi:hypothetical protein [Actinokineospora sp. HUAS TT18]|uniref:hypothetical protein n=1 Tax=Actinokineospora sp. HUAS TT18 TaxID=3447451 RepID=UPI003F51F220
MDIFLIGLVTSTVVVLVFLVVAFTRKGSAATATMTKRRMVLHSAVPPATVYNWLVYHCPPGYSVDDQDPSRGIVILSSRPSLFTYGFFYPAFVYQEGTGTRIEVGIKSRAIQVGPLVTRDHRKLAYALAGLTHSQVEPH